VSGDRAARGDLEGFLGREREAPAVRGPALQGLGLLRAPTPAIEAGLVTALDDPAEEVVEDACLALGLLGRRSTAVLLVRELAEADSVPVQRHMVAALSHLGSTAAVEPLLAVLRESRHEPARRVAAAEALGLLVDERDSDPLFEIDTCTNPYALTQALRPIVTVY
jgi:HEAT repeat protein